MNTPANWYIFWNMAACLLCFVVSYLQRWRWASAFSAVWLAFNGYRYLHILGY